MPDRLIHSEKVVGLKQSLRAVNGGKAAAAYIAENARERVTAPLVGACEEKGVEIVRIPTMKELGELCGIQIGASAAVLIK